MRRTANPDVIVRGFCFTGVSFGLAQKYMNGSVSASDIISDIEREWGSVGIWWGTVGTSTDDFYSSVEDAREYASGAGDEYVADQWEWMEQYQGGPSADAWVGAEVEVVLVGKRPQRDYGAWSPTQDNGEGSIWESTSFLSDGDRIELAQVQYSFDGNNWKTESVGGLSVTAHRTAAEPGGVLPWVPSQNGYYWITKNDDSLEAVTNDGVNRMRLYEKPWGWEWVVRDDIGVVEKGNFGSALRGGDALRDRADDLLAEFDSRPLRRTRGPSRGYQDNYTQAPNTLWSKREALHHNASNEGGVAVVLTFPMEWNEHLAAPDGTPPDQLHVTLGYFGNLEDMDGEAEEDLRAVCAVVSAMNSAFVATLGGIIRFSGEGQDAFVLSVDAPEIEQVRQDFLQELGRWEREPDSTHGFTPHATLGYLYQDEPLPFDRWVPIEVPVVNLELWYGTDRIVYPLGINAEKLSRKTTSQRYAERLRQEGRR